MRLGEAFGSGEQVGLGVLGEFGVQVGTGVGG